MTTSVSTRRSDADPHATGLHIAYRCDLICGRRAVASRSQTLCDLRGCRGVVMPPSIGRWFPSAPRSTLSAALHPRLQLSFPTPPDSDTSQPWHPDCSLATPKNDFAWSLTRVRSPSSI